MYLRRETRTKRKITLKGNILPPYSLNRWQLFDENWHVLSLDFKECLRYIWINEEGEVKRSHPLFSKSRILLAQNWWPKFNSSRKQINFESIETSPPTLVGENYDFFEDHIHLYAKKKNATPGSSDMRIYIYICMYILAAFLH